MIYLRIKPILFNSEMVRAILDGRKTQTRRIIKPQPTNPRWNNIGWLGWDDGHGYRIKPPCEPGDILWGRETWDNIPVSPGGHIRMGGRYYYKADDDLRPGAWKVGKWRPSIHMPKEAARIFLFVRDVRIERLWDMDEEAAISEGFEDSPAGTNSPLERFSTLWDKTIKRDDLRKYGYHANPWVWAIEFERCEKPKGWCEHA